MNHNIDTLLNVHIYKPQGWSHALNIFSLFLIGMVMGIPLLIMILMLRSIIQTQSEFSALFIGFACLLAPLILLMGFNIIQMAINAIMSFFSFIKISPEGIEQKHSIYKHIRANWSEVDKLGKYFLLTDALYLNSYEVLGPSLSLRTPLRFLRPKQGFLSLTGYQGWPNGQLADDLKQYVPELWEARPVMQETQTQERIDQKEATARTLPSQENRLLAALSHASILFSSAGVLVPLVIYVTQKNKSPYLGLQALQAFLWQITAFVFMIITSSCMVGAVLLPTFLATSSPTSRSLEANAGGIFFLMMGSIFLMIFGNLAFLIYGIVGAFLAYQGKDFRYAIVGNLIDRSKNDHSSAISDRAFNKPSNTNGTEE